MPLLSQRIFDKSMRAWLIDIYRSKNNIVLWLKTPDDDIRLEKPFTAELYTDDYKVLDKLKIRYSIRHKKTYYGKKKRVYAFELNRLGLFENIINRIEKTSKHRAALYNADVKPEQLFLYKEGLLPFAVVEVEGNRIIQLDEKETPVLSKAFIEKKHGKIFLNQEEYSLESFAGKLRSLDPDVIVARHAFRLLPELDSELGKRKIKSPFHRWDSIPLRYRGGKTFFSYGRTTYRDYAVRLHGRFLIDASSAIGNECDIDAIIELSQLSGTFFQQVASRSFGAVFQQALIRKMVEQDILVPYKEKPIEPAVSMHGLVKADRVGHTFDPQQGFHQDVAEIDFSSMYPWVMFNRNISAETITSGSGPFEQVPGLPFKISLAKKGLVPRAIKAILERRMEYKKNPTAVNKAKAAGLKWVLVSSYGYCRFREFKLGISSTHMAIGAFAREIILEAASLAEERGFEVVHGIIDSMYIKKKGITDKEVRELCEEIEQVCGIPISFEGIFRWVVFLPSINDDKRPMPARYFGVFRHGEIKARGIEVRQASVPPVVKEFQQELLEMLCEHDKKEEIIARFHDARMLLERHAAMLPVRNAQELSARIVISKADYRNNIPQKIAVERMKKRGIEILPGMKIGYVFASNGIEIPDEYSGRPDTAYYKKLLERAMFVVFQAFGMKRAMFEEKLLCERQARLAEFRPRVRHIFHYARRMPENRRGYSERYIRRKLEKQGWTIWRGGFLNARRKPELYPNVEKKYLMLEKLISPQVLEKLQYMCTVHHGMPDLFCHRRGEFKFVECKLMHEQLSPFQKRCITELLEMGFDVEVHKVVDHRTKARAAEIDIKTGEKKILEKQLMLTKKLAKGVS